MKTLDKEFLCEVKKLAAPSILQLLIGNSFSIIDTLMVSGLGDNAVAATAAAGQIGFILGMILMAVYGMSAFITQFYSSGNHEYVRKTQAIMLLSGTLISFCISLIILIFKVPLLRLFINDEQTVKMGVSYVSIIAIVYVINAIKDSYSGGLNAIGKIKPGLYVGLIGMAMNTFLNYVLIYGKLGFKAYGVEGSAVATLISSIFTAILMIAYIYANEQSIAVRISDFKDIGFRFVKNIYKTTLPLIFHEGFWTLGNMLYAVAFGYLGIAELTTYQLARNINSYFMLGVFGFAYAARIIIGKRLSSNNIAEAVICAQKFTKLTTYSAVVFSILLLVLNPLVVSLFGNLSEEVKSMLSTALYIQGAFLIVNFLNNIWIVGMFGAGGDNLYTLKLIIVTTWFIALPLIFVGAYILKLPFEVIYLMFMMEEISKAIICYFRYKSNKWANNLTEVIS